VLEIGLFHGGSGRDFILSRIMVNDAIFEGDNFDWWFGLCGFLSALYLSFVY